MLAFERTQVADYLESWLRADGIGSDPLPKIATEWLERFGDLEASFE